MGNHDSNLPFQISGVILVGGGGWLMYRYPAAFAKVNAHFGFKGANSPKYLKFMKVVGIVEMALAAISAISVATMTALDLH